jgi:hypothetical protein
MYNMFPEEFDRTDDRRHMVSVSAVLATKVSERAIVKEKKHGEAAKFSFAKSYLSIDEELKKLWEK